MPRFVIGVDVGTYSAKGVLVNPSGRVVAERVVPYDLSIPRPGWAEHDADAIWWSSLCTITRGLLRDADVRADDVAAVFVQAVKADPEAAHVVNLVGRQADTDDVIAAIEKAAPGARIDAAGPPMPIQSPARDETLERMFPQWSVRSLERGVSETIAFYKNASA